METGQDIGSAVLTMVMSRGIDGPAVSSESDSTRSPARRDVESLLHHDTQARHAETESDVLGPVAERRDQGGEALDNPTLGVPPLEDRPVFGLARWTRMLQTGPGYLPAFHMGDAWLGSLDFLFR
jgi:hypothetical protein